MSFNNLYISKNKILNTMLFILIGFIIIYIFYFLFSHSSYDSELSKYKKDTKAIIDNYLSAKISKIEAQEKIEIIEKQVDTSYKENNKQEFFSLKVTLSRLKQAIYYDEISDIKKIYKESLK